MKYKYLIPVLLTTLFYSHQPAFAADYELGAHVEEKISIGIKDVPLEEGIWEIAAHSEKTKRAVAVTELLLIQQNEGAITKSLYVKYSEKNDTKSYFRKTSSCKKGKDLVRNYFSKRRTHACVAIDEGTPFDELSVKRVPVLKQAKQYVDEHAYTTPDDMVVAMFFIAENNRKYELYYFAPYDVNAPFGKDGAQQSLFEWADTWYPTLASGMNLKEK